MTTLFINNIHSFKSIYFHSLKKHRVVWVVRIIVAVLSSDGIGLWELCAHPFTKISRSPFVSSFVHTNSRISQSNFNTPENYVLPSIPVTVKCFFPELFSRVLYITYEYVRNAVLCVNCCCRPHCCSL